ncbi:MAG: hypothetical protein U5L03_11920 [Burkholderiaceae bacterium]|nr:hypothetical protein [Burkholderiaceae bacterium]
MAPSDSGSSISPSPKNAQTLRPSVSTMPAVLQVLHEARLVDRHQRPEAHRHGRELPEVRHQPGMRVGREALAVDLLAEVVQLLLADAALEEGARIDARRRVALDVEQVAAVVLAARVEEVVEADVVEGRRRGEARDVTAERGILAVGLDHHRHRVPAHEGAEPLLDLDVAGRALFLVGRDRVDVRRAGGKRRIDAGLACFLDQAIEQEVRTLRSLALEHGIERIEPFARLDRVGVARIVGGRSKVRYGGHGGLLDLAPARTPRGRSIDVRCGRRRRDWSLPGPHGAMVTDSSSEVSIFK